MFSSAFQIFTLNSSCLVQTLTFSDLTAVPQLTELNTLKKKTPADLWKEDLAVFSEELTVVTLGS